MLKTHPNAIENPQFYHEKSTFEAYLTSKLPQFLYHKVQYLDHLTPIKLCCKSHGFFYATPKQLSSKTFKGCPKCLAYRTSYPYSYKGVTYTPTSFLTQAKLANPQLIIPNHFKGFNQRIVVRCPHHGQFHIKPALLLTKTNCKACSGSVKNTLDAYLTKTKFAHNNRYNYSNTEYKGVINNITVECPHHGPFIVNAREHQTRGVGCPNCTRGLNSKAPSNFYYFHYKKKYIAVLSNRKFDLPKSSDTYIIAYQAVEKTYEVRDYILSFSSFSVDDSSLRINAPHFIFEYDVLNLDR